ncbi:MAG: 16S rRNA (guanine(527)-N(7))-methyltransferase RsmG [Dactylosporangium sp.]|nr:16S rRNA (guanine(527)-N(7))-methyltransferase RsmG [Dactylosporangium sp.]NNJ61065.1 16S rRNA (guanine(527)-N(7))-methyltransferase RsmG [Dactylosporangium sp.]
MAEPEYESAPDIVGGAVVRGGGVPPDAADEEGAARLFGERMPLACRYAELLSTAGVLRGLIGPREAPRLWERHLLNCGAVAELIPYGAFITDIGSGAGLPGIVLAVARPDLNVTLVEPLARRATFLTEVVEDLELVNASVLRARAEDCVEAVDLADVVTARAVASLDRLAAWGLPLAAVGGRLLAIKGASAAEEVAQHQAAVHRAGGTAPRIRRCGADLLATPVTVVEVVRQRNGSPVRSDRPRRGRNRR